MQGAASGMFELMSTMRAMRRLKPDPVPRKLGLRRSAMLFRGMPALEARVESASIYPAVQNLLLAARALGLAANLTAWHLFLEAVFKAAMGIPRDVHTFALIPVGWPVGQFGPTRRRPATEVIHREHW